MKKMLDGKICIVTGGGRGIGKATALLFAEEGGKVAISELDEEPAHETLGQIKSTGGQAIAVVGDITASGAPERLVQATVDAFGSNIDVIANVAGYTWDAFLHKMTDEQWDAILNIHLKAPFRILRAAAPYIRENAKREKEEGKRVMRKVINISSISGTDGNPGQANYSSAKAALIGLTKTLSKEWGVFNVNVNCVAFGWIETRLTKAKEDGAETIEREGRKIALGIPKVGLEALKSVIPLGRPGTAEEAARAILFFASPLSDYVSGQILKVTGGR
ncbi:MAG TPA: SDR family oxidoreductase [Syntrophales bacterium]|nr:SDR family oxidoreductase [Syntrophales bacterium]HPI56311.1 SDR family oxidoreductase [Syntrophales bacterium]HPN24301.1 SDR family oxidoreductase [Syntrophales bacterium]HQM28653.1 SDR family oxidoreductase [Syntrophales bacterium]